MRERQMMANENEYRIEMEDENRSNTDGRQ